MMVMHTIIGRHSQHPPYPSATSALSAIDADSVQACCQKVLIQHAIYDVTDNSLRIHEIADGERRDAILVVDLLPNIGDEGISQPIILTILRHRVGRLGLIDAEHH